MKKNKKSQDEKDWEADCIQAERYEQTGNPGEDMATWCKRIHHQDKMILMHGMAAMLENKGGPVYEQASARYQHLKALYDKGQYE